MGEEDKSTVVDIQFLEEIISMNEDLADTKKENINLHMIKNRTEG